MRGTQREWQTETEEETKIQKSDRVVCHLIIFPTEPQLLVSSSHLLVIIVILSSPLKQGTARTEVP